MIRVSTIVRGSSALTVLLFASVCGHAQNSAGAITGQVFCSDTQKPARFAFVRLVPDVTETDGSNRRNYGSSSTSTAADGTFAMKDVSPGVYDIVTSMPGYIQPIRQLNLFPDTDTANRQIYIKMLTKVVVEAGQTVSATVTAYRGADLTGSVLYDDGTPAAGITVSALIAVPSAGTEASVTASNANLRSAGSNAQTDDRGRFHLTGLADGTYSIQALPRGGGLFPEYLGDTIERTKATLVTVKAGDERTGLDLTLEITNLHQVRGLVTSSDGHAVSSTNVTLALADSTEAQLNTETAADGSFSFSAVPDGRFTVTARGTSTQVMVAGSDINDVVLAATR